MWNASTLAKVHGQIRKAAGLPKNLQLQDFRSSVLTEAGEAGATADQIRAQARHLSRKAGEHYVFPGAESVEGVHDKRVAHRNKKRLKVGIPTA
jgi:hypothetical protein